MRQGATEDIEVWTILESGKTLDNYDVKSVFLYYNNGISDKLLAVYRSFFNVTTTTAEGPPLGADWEYHDLTVDNTPFTDDSIDYAGKLTFTISSDVSNIVQQSKVKKPKIYIEVVLTEDNGTIVKEEYELSEYADSISAGLL